MQHEVGGGANHALGVPELVHRTLHLGMLARKLAHLLDSYARFLQHGFHLVLGPDLGLAQRHLDAAVRVHVAFAGRFHRQEDHVLVQGDDR